MASFREVFDERKQLRNAVAERIATRRRSPEEEQEDIEAAEHGDERRSVYRARESQRLEKIRQKMDDSSPAKKARVSKGGFLLQCPFCESVDDITCADGNIGAVQNCSKCDMSYRGARPDQDE